MNRRRGAKRAYRQRMGDLMAAVATHLALTGPAYPAEIARALGARDGSTWKAVAKLSALGIVEVVPATEGRRNYRLTRGGWGELERFLLPRDAWTLELAESRMRAFEDFEAEAVAALEAALTGGGQHDSPTPSLAPRSAPPTASDASQGALMTGSTASLSGS